MPSQKKKKKARPGYRREADNHHSTKPAIRMNAPSHSSSLRTASTSGRSNLKIRLPPNSKQGYRREADNHSTKPTIRMNAPSQHSSPLRTAYLRAPTSGYPNLKTARLPKKGPTIMHATKPTIIFRINGSSQHSLLPFYSNLASKHLCCDSSASHSRSFNNCHHTVGEMMFCIILSACTYFKPPRLYRARTVDNMYSSQECIVNLRVHNKIQPFYCTKSFKDSSSRTL